MKKGKIASRSSKGIYILFPGALKGNNDVQTKYAKMFPEELYRYKFFLNPVRLAILKSLYEYPRMSTVELKTSLNLSWSMFNTHLDALKKKNYIHVDHLIEDGNPKFIVSLQHHTLVEFENLILVLEAFLNSIPTNILDDLNHNLL